MERLLADLAVLIRPMDAAGAAAARLGAQVCPVQPQDPDPRQALRAGPGGDPREPVRPAGSGATAAPGAVPRRERAGAAAGAGARSAAGHRTPGARVLRAAARPLRAGVRGGPALLRGIDARGHAVPRRGAARCNNCSAPSWTAPIWSGCCAFASPSGSRRARPSINWCRPSGCCTASGCWSWSISTASSRCWRPCRRRWTGSSPAAPA
jgi:hypothetical protein